MLDPDPNPATPDPLETAAAAWLSRLDRGLTAAEQDDYLQWRQQDPRHAAAVARLEGAWAALQPLRDFRPAAARHPDRDLLAQPAPARVFAFPARALALAAAAALVLATGWWGFRLSPTMTFSTPISFSRASTQIGASICRE